MTKMEVLRVFRNKVVLLMLLLLCLFVLLILSTGSVNFKNIPIAISYNNVNEGEIIDIINENMYSQKIVKVESLQEGKELIYNKKVSLFIYIDVKGETDTADIYYDSSDLAIVKMIENLQSKKNLYTYEKITEMLEDYGITLNKSYFERLEFSSVNEVFPNAAQLSFGYELSACIAIIIMFGLSYSMARDNETNVSKMISYMPVGTTRYLLSKTIPYLLLGIVQTFLCLLLGKFVFNIYYQTNILLIALISILFLLSNISLGLLFSTLRSQVATIFCETVSVIFPLFATITTVITGYPLPVQILLNLLPITPYSILLNSMAFNGIIILKYILIMLGQIILYYSLSYLIVNRRVKGK